MANDLRCDWCNNYDASSWSKKQNERKFSSKQKFCSLKCKSEYEDRHNIDWIEEKKGNSILIIIGIIIVLYILSKG